MITKYGNGAVVKTETVFRYVYHVIYKSVLWNGTFKAHL